MSTTKVDQINQKKIGRKAAVAATVGSVIEWYDFFLYGMAAALVFPKLFFAESDPFIATLQSFGTFAVGFLARPVGAAIFGHYGDRLGRKAALVITLFLMGLSSLAIGLLPTYATIGVWAPTILILLRFIQGIGVGGEWGGAVLLSMEWGNKKNQALMAAWPQMGVSSGMLLSSLMVALFMFLSGEAFFTWGWRIPFILSFVLLIAGYFIRMTIPETPSYQKVLENKLVVKNPVLEVLKKYRKQVALTAVVRLSENGPFYIYTVLIMTIGVQMLNIDKQLLVNANTIGAIVMMICIPTFGYLADKYGTNKMYMIGVLATVLWAFPYMGLVSTGQLNLVILATVLSMIPHSMQVGPQGAMVAKVFPAHLRYSGLSLGSQFGAIIAGGAAPLVCTYLLYKFNSLYAVSFYILFLATCTFTATVMLRRYDEIADNPSDITQTVEAQ
ncbi:MFS transporter [Brevibacillus daliensis]|uniref:MFS transporter n=1 Tax=Brevibacillus daliensis TaxID=2892995 RepID=UPI001E513225|nr:MFS transporter [Brevibacillus daliensis]